MIEAEKLLAGNIRAAELVAQRLAQSVERLAGVFPITGDQFKALDDDHIESIDAFIKRFEQLQDLLANRLFRGIAILEQEDVTSLSRRDLAQLMEKLGVIPSADEWTRLSVLRNQLAHEYPDQPEKQTDRLNAAFPEAPRLVTLVHAAREYVKSKGLA